MKDWLHHNHSGILNDVYAAGYALQHARLVLVNKRKNHILCCKVWLMTALDALTRIEKQLQPSSNQRSEM